MITISNKIYQLQRKCILMQLLFNNKKQCLHRSSTFMNNWHLLKSPRKIKCTLLEQNDLHFAPSVKFCTETKTMSGDDCKAVDIHYEDLLKAQKDDNILIIDVREQSEIDETGKLPGSIHIPMGNVSNVLTNLSDQTFKEKFEKQKPNKDTKIILSCRSGRRSAMVQAEIQKLGYENTYNYIGGWLDWESKQKG